MAVRNSLENQYSLDESCGGLLDWQLRLILIQTMQQGRNRWFGPVWPSFIWGCLKTWFPDTIPLNPKDCDGLWFVSSNKPQPSQGLSKIESSSILRVEKALLQSSYWYSFWKSLSEILKFWLLDFLIFSGSGNSSRLDYLPVEAGMRKDHEALFISFGVACLFPAPVAAPKDVIQDSTRS